MVFDRNVQYPPLEPPRRPVFDAKKIKDMVLTAVDLSADVKTVLDDPGTDPKLKTFALFAIGVIDALQAIAEDGLLPLAAGGGGVVAGMAMGAAARGDRLRSLLSRRPLLGCGSSRRVLTRPTRNQFFTIRTSVM
jgi:hypothetical protein